MESVFVHALSWVVYASCHKYSCDMFDAIHL